MGSRVLYEWPVRTVRKIVHQLHKNIVLLCRLTIVIAIGIVVLAIFRAHCSTRNTTAT